MITILKEKLGDSVKADMVLAPYSTFKMGGKAQYYFEATSTEDLLKAYNIALDLKIPFTLLGGISNVVIMEKGIEGLVVRNRNSYKKVVEETEDFVVLEVGTGYIMTSLVRETTEAGYEGFEYQMGLPGTLGGGIVMNSKWTHPRSYIGDNLLSAEIITKEGKLVSKEKEYFDFSYGYSSLQKTKEIVVSARFNMNKVDPAILKQRAKESLDYRKMTQPYGVATSGCFFKNTGEYSAGKLIDDAGLKGTKVGGLYVSDIHANFIVNSGTGTIEDLKKLLSLIKDTVQKKYHITLKEEVIIL
jgi:UDP-N-acetylmuramate dehydrogenase